MKLWNTMMTTTLSPRRPSRPGWYPSRKAARSGRSVRPGLAIVTEHASDPPEVGDEQRLDHHVAEEPRQLGELTAGVAQPADAAHGFAAVAGHRLRPTEVAPLAAPHE